MKIRAENNPSTASHSSAEADPSLKTAALPIEITASGWNFSEPHRIAYSAIVNDPGAKMAFEKLTSGSRKIAKSILLLALTSQMEAYSKNRIHGKSRCKAMQHRDSSHAQWNSWNRKWKGIGSAGKSLRLVASKLNEHLGQSHRGPVPFPMVTGMIDESDEYYLESHRAEKRMHDIAEQIAALASEIDKILEIRQSWLSRMPQKDRSDAIEKEQLVLFMRLIKSRTGRPYIEQIAALLNAVRGTSGSEKEVGIDFLRKLSKRFTTPRISRAFPSL